MDYEQYLYGRAARDGSCRGPQTSRHGRIGSLVAGVVVALGIVAAIAALSGAKADRAEAPAARTSEMAVTLAASESVVLQPRR